MPNVIISEACHREIRMVIALLKSDPHTAIALFGCRFLEILGQELALVVEIVGCALWCVSEK